jgi:hypothetical protein
MNRVEEDIYKTEVHVESPVEFQIVLELLPEQCSVGVSPGYKLLL